MTTSAGVSSPSPSPSRAWSRTAAPEPLYFGPAEARAFGWYHAAAPVADDTPALVICPPHGYEELCSHRALRHLALAAAAAGIPCLRIDYHGTGDAAGSDLDADGVAAWERSVAAAVDELRARSGHRRVALFGLRLGAALATRVAAGRGDVDDLVLWAPVVTGRAYLRELRAFARLHAGAILDAGAAELPPGAFEVGGFVIGEDVQRGLESIDLAALQQAPAGRVLVVPRGGIDVETPLVARLTGLGSAAELRRIAGYAEAMLEPHNAVAPAAVIEGAIAWLLDARAIPANAAATDAGQPATSSACSVLDLPAPAEATRLDGGARSAAAWIRERPLSFGTHAPISGVLTEPRLEGSAAPRRTGIVLINGGAVHRVGPNRMHVTLARAWAALGYRVLRIDLTGLGDTPVRPGAEENRTYSAFSVPDVQAAMAELRAHGAEQCVIAGLCSGAHASFHTALLTPDVAGAIMINPIVFYWDPSMALDVSAWRTARDTHQYKQSVRRWQSWSRLLRGQVRLEVIARFVVARGAQIVRARAAALARLVRPRPANERDEARDLARIAAQGTDTLLVFSEGEPGLDQLLLHHGRAVERLRRKPGFRLQVLDRADHIFSTLEARRRLAALLTSHLLERHP